MTMRPPKLLTYKDVVGISTLQQVSQGGTVNIFTGPVQVGNAVPVEAARLEDDTRTYKKITVSVPAGWRMAQSTVFGYPYYINEKDNKSQWEPPEFDESLAMGRKGKGRTVVGGKGKNGKGKSNDDAPSTSTGSGSNQRAALAEADTASRSGSSHGHVAALAATATTTDEPGEKRARWA